MVRRREFMGQGFAGIAALGLGGVSACRSMGRVSASPKLAGHEADWTFVGEKDWSQDHNGIIYSPVWNQCVVRKDGNDLTKREDFACPLAESLADTEVSLEFRTYYWSVDTVGIVFRAQDSLRYYYVELGDAGKQYDVRLLVRDATGYRRELASGFAHHNPPPEGWFQMVSSRNHEEWAKVTPGWIKLRVQAQGDLIQVLVDEKKILEVKDATYSAGRIGLLARGPVQFRNLHVAGKRATTPVPWAVIDEERPPYFHPWPDPEKKFGDNQTYPGIFRTARGDLMIWTGVTGDPHAPEDTLLVRSRDEGKTWGEPFVMPRLPDGKRANYFFGYRDGRISCLYGKTFDWDTKVKGPRIAYSSDDGKTWSKATPLLVSGKPLYEYGKNTAIGPYSPIMSLSDGTLLQFCYEVNTKPDGSPADEDERRDRSLVIRSTDDGKTWEGPYYLDPQNFDSNECMAAELADGTLIAFARTLRAPFMWVSKSKDKGKTWSKQVQSSVTGVSPILLRHSSGVLIMGSRSWGISLTTSSDEGKTWSRPTIISIVTGMMGMTEVKDGRMLIVFHEAYRTPTRIRAQYMHVGTDGTLTPGSDGVGAGLH